MTSAPAVSVVMAVHNGARYVEQAVRSILDQTLADLEFVVVDDGSRDRTPHILETLAGEDSRLRVVAKEHSGIADSANQGVALARGRYVARMDADDVSLPNRLERQLTEIERRPTLGVLGSRVLYIDHAGRAAGEWRVPTGASLVRWSLLFGCALAHPTVIMRRELLGERPYNWSAPFAEDYELWVRLAATTDLDNLPEPLLQRRVHGRSVSDLNEARQEASVTEVMHRAATVLAESDVDPIDVRLLRRAVTGRAAGAEELERAARVLRGLLFSYLDARAEADAGTRAVLRDARARLLALGSLARHDSLVSAARIVLSAVSVGFSAGRR